MLNPFCSVVGSSLAGDAATRAAVGRAEHPDRFTPTLRELYTTKNLAGATNYGFFSIYSN
jgi:hypothetical protein